MNTAHEHYSKYYDDATLALIEPWVRPDLIATGYEFEPDPEA